MKPTVLSKLGISALAASLWLLFAFPAAAVDQGTIKYNELLLNLKEAGAPILYEDAVILTANAYSADRVGVAFAHEGYSQIHWFKKLAKPEESAARYKLLFTVYEYPRALRELTYRLVFDGQWSADPWNPLSRRDKNGLTVSYIHLPTDSQVSQTLREPSGVTRFVYRGNGGLNVSVAGTFNGWDPFMYEMKECAPGLYELSLNLPVGLYRYAFFLNGEQIPDPGNPNRVYAKDGRAASELAIR